MSKYALWKSKERETRRDLERAGFDSVRNYASQFENSDGADVIATDGEHKIIVQVKAGKKHNPKAAYREAKSAVTGKHDKPVVRLHYTDSKESFAVLRWSDFMGLLKREW